MSVNFKETEKKLKRDRKVMESYKDLKPKYSIIRAMIKARLASGLSQEEVAARMSTSQSAIARLESGSQLPSLNTIFKFAKATGTIPMIHFIQNEDRA
jgi:ribosome-binding protein aMBF1 (putative translation factor)